VSGGVVAAGRGPESDAVDMGRFGGAAVGAGGAVAVEGEGEGEGEREGEGEGRRAAAGSAGETHGKE